MKKTKHSFLRRISFFFLAATVLASSLCLATPVSAASSIVSGVSSETSSTHYEISGTWVFNETLVLPSSDLFQGVIFTSNSGSGLSIKCTAENLRYALNSSSWTFVYTASAGWADDAYRLIDFGDVQNVNSEFYAWLVSNATPYVDLVSNAREQTSGFLSVFSSIGEWVVSSFLSLVALFWVPESGLTFFGVLAVSGLAFALIFLLIRWILSLVHR